MLSFQALSLIVYAIGRDALLSIGAAVVVFVKSRHRPWRGLPGHADGHYPYLWGAGTLIHRARDRPHRGGLLSNRRVPAGIGACHPCVNCCLAGTGGRARAGLGFPETSRRASSRRSRILSPAAPWRWQACWSRLIFIYDVPRTDPAEVSRTYAAFVRFFDYHRRYAADLGSTGVSFNRVGLALGLIWLIGFARDLARPAVFLLKVIVVTAAMSLAFVFLSWMPPDRLPMTLSILMPARLLNVNVMIVAPLLLGLMGVYRQKLVGAALDADAALRAPACTGKHVLGLDRRTSVAGMECPLRPHAGAGAQRACPGVRRSFDLEPAGGGQNGAERYRRCQGV